MRMIMNASIMSVEFNVFYIMEANVFDHDEKQAYKGEIVAGLSGLAELLRLKKEDQKKPGSVSDAELQQAADQVEMPPLMQPIQLRVRRVKTNKAGFTSLICSLEQV
jgi:hypothetical protein